MFGFLKCTLTTSPVDIVLTPVTHKEVSARKEEGLLFPPPELRSSGRMHIFISKRARLWLIEVD